MRATSRARCALVCAFALISSAPYAFGQPDVTTANYDQARTNSNLTERHLNIENVSSRRFGKLFSLPVDGAVIAQPLYLHELSIGNAVHNVVFAATMHNSVYAFDADSGVPIWQVHFGPPVPTEIFPDYFDIKPEVGILSTPVIDRQAGLLYVVSANFEGERYKFLLHALDLQSGEERLEGPVEISGSDTAKEVAFDPFQHFQRPGLTLSAGILYIAFGSHGDMVPFNGWLFAYDAHTLQQVSAFSTTPPEGGGAIWQSGRAIAVDENGILYVTTGNGAFNPDLPAWSNSILRLRPAPELAVEDHFTPWDEFQLSEIDLDVGAAGAMLIPGTNLIASGGKSGKIYLMDRASLGQQQADDAGAVDTLRAAYFGIFNYAIWNNGEKTLLYARGIGLPVRAWSIQDGKFGLWPESSQPDENAPPNFGDGIVVSADGANAGSAIVWMTVGDELSNPATGTLFAFDAADLSRELWNSNADEADKLGLFSKFANPTVANGKVFVPTSSGAIAVYGLKPEHQPEEEAVQ